MATFWDVMSMLFTFMQRVCIILDSVTIASVDVGLDGSLSVSLFDAIMGFTVMAFVVSVFWRGAKS